MSLFKTLNALPPADQRIVEAMSRAISAVLRDNAITPLNDDRGAVLDEACAVYLKQCHNSNQLAFDLA